jgi:hypothetical protein
MFKLRIEAPGCGGLEVEYEYEQDYVKFLHALWVESQRGGAASAVLRAENSLRRLALRPAPKKEGKP